MLAVAFALRFALMPADIGYGYIAFVPGIVLLALVAGPGPALLYTALSSVLAMVAFPPANGLPGDVDDLAGFVFCALSGVAITSGIQREGLVDLDE